VKGASRDIDGEKQSAGGRMSRDNDCDAIGGWAGGILVSLTWREPAS